MGNKTSWLYRVGWLIFLWGASVVGLGIIAFLIRMLMILAGFKV
ncbi:MULTISPECIES: DUF2474 domain-containing protein [Legionella]|uniref:DUF2474 domain-containing protein n=1 Tax=Legionella resiliens TaxID=2905958 RepID=A0ABS8X6M0_9GAMM|nr:MULTISPECIES: DUF2474 domain-containing protein [unclassified Legionella]MCE0723599.1 DUF2474 domain-containing protein [Legionella sp. 9fVS26]MCE3532753.1 DUF2474 domain-containing protein [Legionella sp. 8cVS16]